MKIEKLKLFRLVKVAKALKILMMYSNVRKVQSAKDIVLREEKQLKMVARNGVLRKMVKSVLMIFNATLNIAIMKLKSALKEIRKV